MVDTVEKIWYNEREIEGGYALLFRFSVSSGGASYEKRSIL